MLQKKRYIALTSLIMIAVALGCAAASNAGQLAMDGEAFGVAPPPVYFNHTYGVISPATVEALQTNAYINDHFIDVEVRTTVRPDLTYTGTYLNARETYLELFAEGSLGLPLGATGVALGDEVEGGIQAIQAMWKAALGEDQVTTVDLVTHDVNGVDTPWFYAVDPIWGDVSEYTGFWAMEYVPNPGSTAPRTRREERAERYDPAKLAQNILGVIYGLPDDDRANMQTTLSASGWKVYSPWWGGFLAISPPDNGAKRFIYAKPAKEGRIGILGIVWRLNRYSSHTELLGDAVLKVGIEGAPLAVLWLVPPEMSEPSIVALVARVGRRATR
jgi:hypothetical protein